MQRKTLNLLTACLVVVLTACGGGGGGGSGGGATGGGGLAVTGASIPAQAVTIDPRAEILLYFSGDLGTSLSTPGLVQLTDGTNVVPTNLVPAGLVLTVKPASPLKLRTHYTLTVKAGFASSSGVLANDYALSFRTNVAVFDTRRIVPADGNLNTGVVPVIAAGDMNGDGRQDVVELAALQNRPDPFTAGYTLNRYVQTAQGAFEKAQQIDHVTGPTLASRSASKVVLMDIDGDGVPEILVPEFTSTEDPTTGLRIFGRSPTGPYQASGFIPSAHLQRLHVADVDGDGRLDLIGGASGNYAAGFQVFLNEGAKSTSAPTGLRAMGVVDLPPGIPELAVTSLNRDGSRQVLVNTARLSSTAQPPLLTRMLVYTQGVRGVFSPDAGRTALVDEICAGFVRCASMRVVDINGDGLPDLLFGDAFPKSVAYVRSGATFAKAFETTLGGFAYVADADRDGLDDLMIVANRNQPFVAVAAGQRSTDFAYSTMYPVPLSNVIDTESAAAIADMNDDGLPDIVVDQVNSGIFLMLQRKF